MSQRAAMDSRSDSVVITFRDDSAPYLLDLPCNHRQCTLEIACGGMDFDAQSPRDHPESQFLDVVHAEYAMAPLRELTEHHVVQKLPLTFEKILVLRIKRCASA